jgi:hypothetical protein
MHVVVRRNRYASQGGGEVKPDAPDIDLRSYIALVARVALDTLGACCASAAGAGGCCGGVKAFITVQARRVRWQAGSRNGPGRVSTRILTA